MSEDTILDRDHVDQVVREVLKDHVLLENTPETRKSIIFQISKRIPTSAVFQVICDSWNNGPEEITSKIICCDVYFNDAEDNLVCMEFQADRSILSPDEISKMKALDEAKSKNSIAS